MGVFSVTANAEALETPDYRVFCHGYVYDYTGSSVWHSRVETNPFNDTIENYADYAYTEITDKLKWTTEYYVQTSDYGILVPKGNDTTVVLVNIDDMIQLDNPDNDNIANFRHRVSADLRAQVTYANGSSEVVDVTMSSKNDGWKIFELEFVPTDDVIQIYLRVISTFSKEDISPYLKSTSYGTYMTLTKLMGGEKNVNGISLEIKQQSEEAGLLSGLIEWVKSIWENLKTMGENLKNGFTNVINGIIELPSKIWTFISEGLQDLFIPDAERLASMKDNMSEMLESKLGAIYQVGTIVTDLWDGIEMADQTNTIEIPVTQIPLPEGATFSFGGYQVKIVPDGFDFLATAVKLLSGILCTVLFVNGMRKRYDNVMGVKE